MVSVILYHVGGRESVLLHEQLPLSRINVLQFITHYLING